MTQASNTNMALPIGAKIFVDQPHDNINAARCSAVSENNAQSGADKHACKKCRERKIVLKRHMNLEALKNP